MCENIMNKFRGNCLWQHSKCSECGGINRIGQIENDYMPLSV